MKFRVILFLFLVLGITLSAQARMYQWVNPNSKQIQLSGIPPAWYRSASGGPRVRVFERGSLIDDTSIVLSPSQRDDLRDAAFDEFQQRRQSEALRKLEMLARRKALKEKEDVIRAERVAVEDAQRLAKQQQEADESDSVDGETVDASMVDKLKSLIGQFDIQSTRTLKSP